MGQLCPAAGGLLWATSLPFLASGFMAKLTYTETPAIPVVPVAPVGPVIFKGQEVSLPGEASVLA